MVQERRGPGPRLQQEDQGHRDWQPRGQVRARRRLNNFPDANDDVDVRDAERSDAGQYYCRAENLVGTRDSDAARLSVHSESYFRSF